MDYKHVYVVTFRIHMWAISKVLCTVAAVLCMTELKACVCATSEMSVAVMAICFSYYVIWCFWLWIDKDYKRVSSLWMNVKAQIKLFHVLLCSSIWVALQFVERFRDTYSFISNYSLMGERNYDGREETNYAHHVWNRLMFNHPMLIGTTVNGSHYYSLLWDR